LYSGDQKLSERERDAQCEKNLRAWKSIGGG
jgi:hypothetical protein